METPTVGLPFDGLVPLPAMSLDAHRPKPVALLAPEPNDGSRSGLCGRRGSLFWLWQANPRARSPLLRRLRLCYGLISDPSSGISRLNGISVSVWASALPPLHSRDQQTSMQHEIASVRPAPWNPGRHLPVSVPLAATSPVLPVPSAYDRAREPWPTSNGARNKPGL